ncbi:hypothetical protein HK104_004364, partial [Borealophlyctis nickersoniae]
DDNGHGTFVSSIIGGRTFGVAKQVSLVAVKKPHRRDEKVLDAHGVGTISGLIQGIQYAATIFNASLEAAVINISAEADFNNALNKVVNAVVAFGIPTVVSAGNDASDACTVSPGSATSALTISAIDINDTVATFSNTGPCVDMFAPGVKVAGIRRNGTEKTMSGTSFSAPYVTGAVAAYWGEDIKRDGGEIVNWGGGNATSGVVEGLGVFNEAKNLLVRSPECWGCRK